MTVIMYRRSWWQRKIRRCFPYILALAIIYLVYTHLPGKSTKTKSSSSSQATRITLTEPAPYDTWVVIVSDDFRSCNTLASSYPHWTLLFVGKGNRDGAHHSSCVFLDPEAGVKMLRDIYKEEDPSPLTIGNLYAIKMGAEAIYTPVPDTPPSKQAKSYFLSEFPDHTGLMPDTRHMLFTAESHFGCNMTVVKHSIAAMTAYDRVREHQYKLCSGKTPVIQAQARLYSQRQLKKVSEPKTNMPLCDTMTPPVVLPPSMFATFDLKGSLVLKPAFWALFMETELDTGGAEEWDKGSLMLGVQRLLWLQGDSMMVYYSQEGDKIPAAAIDLNVINTINELLCSTNITKQCITELLSKLRESSQLSEDMLMKVKTWFKALESMSYVFPGMPNGHQPLHKCDTHNISFHPVNHTGHIPVPAGLENKYTPVMNTDTNRHFYKTVCPEPDPEYKVEVDFTRPWIQMGDIMLIVVFNKPHFEVIPYVESLYRAFFPRMVYCGPGEINYDDHPELKEYKLSYIPYKPTPSVRDPGSFNYECVSSAIKFKSGASGYLAIADDLLLFPGQLQSLHKHLAWFLPRDRIRIGHIRTLRECRLGMCDFHPHWHWWEDYQQQTISALDYMSSSYDATIYKCYKQMVSLNGGEYRPNGAYSDIYYIPQRLEKQFAQLADVFLTYQVFLEIAIPSIIRCLENPDDIQPLPGKTVWDYGKTRDEPWTFFNRENILAKTHFHPTKWSYIKKGSEEMTDFYCNIVLPFLHDPYERIKK